MLIQSLRRCTRLTLLGLVFATSSCASLSDEDARKLDNHRENAVTYLLGQEFERALQQTELGLRIDADDYLLLSTRALCKGYLAGDVFGRLEKAEPYFDRVYDLRDPLDQQPLFLLEFAKVKQRIAAEQRRQAQRNESEAEDPTLPEATRSEKRGRARALREDSERRSDLAQQALETLIERQELVRTANRILMAITAERGDLDGAIAYANRAIETLETQKASLQKDIDNLLDLRRTLAAREGIESLITEEMLIRSRLSALYFQQEDYARAIQQLDVVLELDPNRSFDYYNRGFAHEKLGNRLRAVENFNNFLSTTDLPQTDSRVLHAFDYTRTLP